MSLPSKQATIRDNVVAAIKALPNWPADWPVEKIGIPQDLFYRGLRRAVGVCLTEDTWHSLDLGLSDPLDQPAEMDLVIVVYATSELSPTGALEPDDGGIDGIVGLILGSNAVGYGAGLRSADVGVAFVTGGVRCRAVKTAVMADEHRSVGNGGGLAKLLFLRTTAFGL